MSRHIKSKNRRIWRPIADEFVLLDPKNPIDREEELLQLNDQALPQYMRILMIRYLRESKILSMLVRYGIDWKKLMRAVQW